MDPDKKNDNSGSRFEQSIDELFEDERRDDRDDEQKNDEPED